MNFKVFIEGVLPRISHTYKKIQKNSRHKVCKSKKKTGKTTSLAVGEKGEIALENIEKKMCT